MSKCRTVGCTEDPTDGEGYDGYCGSCEDKWEDIMGYTHYWTQTRNLTPTEMGDIAASVRRIINGADCDICGPHGDEGSKAILTKDSIAFNGRDENSHETFHVSPAGMDNFCKTARKPYDVVVTACLTFLQADYGFEIGSDGDVTDWEDGVALAERALGRAYANPLIVEAMLA